MPNFDEPPPFEQEVVTITAQASEQNSIALQIYCLIPIALIVA